MKNLLTVVAIGLLGWYGITKYQSYSSSRSNDVFTEGDEAVPSQSFSCDGRTRCSQMRSCDEAICFVRNCPGIKMDGDGDGVPCESQWCGSG